MKTTSDQVKIICAWLVFLVIVLACGTFIAAGERSSDERMMKACVASGGTWEDRECKR